jgi:hypothetical protein
MEAIVALGLVANIFQLISFTHESISLVKRIAENGTPDPGLLQYAEQLSAISKDLESRICDAQITPSPLTKVDNDLLEVARNLSTVSQRLQVKLTEISSSRFGKYGKFMKYKLSRQEVEQMERTVSQYTKVLELQVLSKLRLVFCISVSAQSTPKVLIV